MISDKSIFIIPPLVLKGVRLYNFIITATLGWCSILWTRQTSNTLRRDTRDGWFNCLFPNSWIWFALGATARGDSCSSSYVLYLWHLVTPTYRNLPYSNLAPKSDFTFVNGTSCFHHMWTWDRSTWCPPLHPHSASTTYLLQSGIIFVIRTEIISLNDVCAKFYSDLWSRRGTVVPKTSWYTVFLSC